MLNRVLEFQGIMYTQNSFQFLNRAKQGDLLSGKLFTLDIDDLFH